jgi:probable F420-dependent oxidoreductase
MVAGAVIPFWLDRPPGEALVVGARAGEFGYPELWIGEMLHFDAFALAGAVAASHPGPTLTVGPLALGLRDPVMLAMGAASVSVIGGRPARLAVGASSPAVVRRWHGRSWGGEAELVEPAVELIRSVMAGERTSQAGVVSSQGFRSPLAPLPAHISVAAAGPRMMAAAARCADRLVLNLVTPEQVAPAVATGLAVAVWVVAGVDPTEEGMRQVRGQLARYLAAPGYAGSFRRAGWGPLVDAAKRGAPVGELALLLDDRHLEAVAALGDRRQVQARVDQYRQAGAEVMIVPVTAGDEGGARTLAALAP